LRRCRDDRRIVLGLCLVGILGPATWAEAAQGKPATKGFWVEGHFTLGSGDGAEVRLNGEVLKTKRETNVGGGLSVAYGATEWLTVYLNGDGTEGDEEHVLSHGDLGAQVFLRSGHRLRPHLDVALTGRRVVLDAGAQTIDARGSGLSLGGGVVYFLSSALALDATLLRSVGELDQF